MKSGRIEERPVVIKIRFLGERLLRDPLFCPVEKVTLNIAGDRVENILDSGTKFTIFKESAITREC